MQTGATLIGMRDPEIGGMDTFLETHLEMIVGKTTPMSLT